MNNIKIDDTVLQFREKVVSKIGISDLDLFFYNNKNKMVILDDSKKLSDYSLENGSYIYVGFNWGN